MQRSNHPGFPGGWCPAPYNATSYEMVTEMNEIRTCRACKRPQPATSEFFGAFVNRGVSGLRHKCKKCHASYVLLRRRAKGVRPRPPANPDATRERRRTWQKRNRGRLAEYRRRHLSKPGNLERSRCAARQYYREHKKAAYLRHKTRRQNDPLFRLRLTVSCAVRSSLRHLKRRDKPCGWERLVGYTKYELRDHLERQFKKGMTWQNMGREGWHIDHIVPVSSFNIREPGDAEFRACWALTNLRPEWQTDNLRKSATRLHLL